MLRFIVGMMVGAFTVWYLADDIRRVGNGTRRARERAADALETMDVRAGELLDSAKEQVSSTLRAGQDAIRPRP